MNKILFLSLSVCFGRSSCLRHQHISVETHYAYIHVQMQGYHYMMLLHYCSGITRRMSNGI